MYRKQLPTGVVSYLFRTIYSPPFRFPACLCDEEILTEMISDHDLLAYGTFLHLVWQPSVYDGAAWILSVRISLSSISPVLCSWSCRCLADFLLISTGFPRTDSFSIDIFLDLLQMASWVGVRLLHARPTKK